MRRPVAELRGGTLVDVVLAVGFAGLAMVELSHPLEEVHTRGRPAADVVLQLAFCATLLLRSRRPVVALATASALFLLPALVTAHAGFFFANEVPLLLLCFTVARSDHGAWSRWAWLSGVAFWLGLVLHAGASRSQVANPLLPVGLPVIAWGVARVLHRLQLQRTQLMAARDRLQAEQGARQRVAVARERSRVAADMHDVVAHAVSLMVVQVGAARMSLERSGSRQPVLRVAETTGRQALHELRRSLGVLRVDGGVAEAEPAPGELAPGEPVDVALPGTPSTLTFDVLLAAAFACVAVAESLDTSIDDGTRAGPVWLNVALGVMTCVPLAWRRRTPSGAYLAMVAVLLLPSAVTPHSLYLLGSLLPLCVGAFSAARGSDGPVARLAWVPALLPPAVLHQSAVGAAVSDVVFLLVFLGSAWASGRAMRRFDLQGIELRATLRDVVEEEAAREDEAVEEERRRIAAEMHDVVAHAVSLMVVQIGATRMETADAAERERLRAAEGAGRQALVELRSTLGLLTDGEPTLTPLPGQEAIPSLIEGFRRAGLDVTEQLDLQVPLPAGLALAVYRVVQEALTNALKHGRGGPVSVQVRSGPDVRISVVNELGTGRSLLPSGRHGLHGMRERLAPYGGEVTTQAAGGHFRLHAVVPLARLEVTR
jgi:signal transduction histidine kinase